MTNDTHDFAGGGSGGLLDEAVAAIRARPAPRHAMRRTVEAAAAWGERPPRGLLAAWERRRVALIALAGAACVGAAALIVHTVERNPPAMAIGGNPSAMTLPTAPERAGDPSAATLPAASQRATFYMPTPATFSLVAERATVIVSAGPAQPVDLGSTVQHDDIRSAAGPGVTRLHVWDWSASRTSRVVTVNAGGLRVAGAAVSSDGTGLLDASGMLVDLSSGATRHVGGFETAPDQRVERVRFAPGGMLAAALVSRSDNAGRVEGWTVRVIDLDAGTAVREFDADDVDWFAWAAFMPDGAGIVHADPANVVTRRDARTGTVLAGYEPALEPHGAVGIAVSPDGALVASGHYHGELFVWDAASGRLVTREPFRRADGEPDPFWQAKVLAFSPDGTLLATSSSTRVQIVEARTGNVVARVDAPPLPSHVTHLRWSPDGRRMTLVLSSEVVTGSAAEGRPPRSTADVLPRVFSWDWQGGNAPAELVPAGR